MANIVSPGVYVIEKDISNYPATIDSTTVGVVGFAQKGPTDVPILITSPERLVDTFGAPTEALEGQGLLGALEILEATNKVYYVRVATDTAKQASATASLGVCPAIAVSGVGLGNGSSLTVLARVTDHTGASGYLFDKYYTIPSTGYTSQFNALAGVFGVDFDGAKISASYPFSVDENGVKTPLASNTDDTTGAVNGFIVGAFAGSGATLYLSATEPVFMAVDKNGQAVEATRANAITVSGCSIQTSDVAYLAESLYPGAGYNLGTKNDGSVSGNSLEVDALGGANFIVSVNEEGSVRESFKASFISGKSFLTDTINQSEDGAVSDVIQGNIIENSVKIANPEQMGSFSDQITSLVSLTSVDMVSGLGGTAVTDANPRFVKLVQGTYALVNGDNGSTSNQALRIATVIGDPTNKSGLYALDDDVLNLTIGVIPGIHDQQVQQALITLAETSQNFLACVAPPYGAADTLQEIIDWSNGFSDERTTAINSSYAAIYWPWVRTFIPSLGEDRWLDPAIYGARQIAYTAATAELWFAPAGFVRGRLTKPFEVQTVLNQGDRDSMYSGGNAINPIVNFPQQGITIFGQRTAQREPTALDRINVRMLMIYLRKVLLLSTTRFAFEPNDSILWAQIEETVNPLLDDIKRRRGITEFKVICDETVNTPVRVDRNEVWCKILLKPTKAAEAVVFEINVTSQSAKISG